MKEDKLLRLIKEAGIQKSDEETESDTDVCNMVLPSTSIVRSHNENNASKEDFIKSDANGKGASDLIAFNGDLESSMSFGLLGSNAMSSSCAKDTELYANSGDVAFIGEDNPSAHNAQDLVENNNLLNFTTGFFEDGGSSNSKNNSTANNNTNLLVNPETGLLENILEQRFSATSNQRLQLINPETGLLEDVPECLEPDEDADVKRGKKRKRNPATWNKNKTVINNLKSHVTRAIPLCRCKCVDKLNQQECKEIFSKFINLANHTEQNIYLQGCLLNDIPNRFRPRKKSESARNRRVFKYNVNTGNRTVTVCQQTFLAIHGIQRDRLRRKVMHLEKDIQDGRGRHNNHPTCQQETVEIVHTFLSNLPARESHYSRSSNKHKKYLDSHLSVAELHRKFLKDNPRNQIKYDKFREIFNFDFNYAFGQPRKDICHSCEKFKVKIDAAQACNNQVEKETLERDHELHLRKAQVFLERLSKTENEKERTKMSLCFDYQKNLPLPVTNVGDEYYLRQLWMHNFGVHNLQDNSATMYLYTENFALKGPNEVLTALQDYIQTNKNPHQTHLELFCDNCYSQNKNRYLFAFLDQMCAKGIFETVTIFYPIPGHSMMPIDRDFALIERKRIKSDKIFSPDFYINLILNSKNTNKFKIVCLQKNLSGEDIVDRVVTVKDFKGFYDGRIKTTVPGISTCRQVQFHKNGKPGMSQSMTSQRFNQFTLYQIGIARILRGELINCYHGQIKLKEAKVRDIIKLLDYIPLEARQFYDNIINYNEEYGEHAAEDVANEAEEEEQELED